MDSKQTPYSKRLEIFNKFSNENTEISYGDCISCIKNPTIRNMLVDDVNAIIKYRKSTGPISRAVVKSWFPDDDEAAIFNMIDTDRDFIYTKYGLRILVNRYFFLNEPIQLGIARIAKNLSNGSYELMEVIYDLLSCGFMHVSSMIAAADHSNGEAMRPGESCRLMVAKDGYGDALVLQLIKLSQLLNLGVGVGFGVSNLPLLGKTERGKIRNGFLSVVEYINSCNFICTQERKPKTALYIHAHNDSLYQALKLKAPSRATKLNNIFIGLMIPNHFMEAVRNDRVWHLFPGDLLVDGHNLSDFYGDEYVKHYNKCVNLKKYTETHKARDIMHDIIQSLVESGSPYIIWSDHLNEFNNHKNYGTIKTLNLCAEITNFCDASNDSSCVLLSCNMGMYRDFPNVVEKLNSYLTETFQIRYTCEEFEYPELAKYAYMLGYYGVVILNNLIGDSRERREIGLNPLGVYDMALISQKDPIKVCSTISEALYRGAVTASCDEYANTGTVCSMYEKSMFRMGKPQFVLRNAKPQSDWTYLLHRMRYGMANSMLTAQAPTATTSLLTGVTESVIIPISHYLTKESENGRNDVIPYGVMYNTMNKRSIADLDYTNNIDLQIGMYSASLPYVDHSQSTMFSLDIDTAQVFDLIVKTYKMKLKTGIYYLVFKQNNTTLSSIRDGSCSSCAL